MDEQTPGRQYPVPVSDGLIDSDEAAVNLKQMYSDASTDVSHPYSNASHPLHKDYVNHATTLHERAAEGRETDVDRIEREGNEYMAEKQAKVDKEGKLLREELIRDFDFEPVDIQPGTTQQWQLDIWRMQKQWAKKEYLPLASALESESRKLGGLRDVAPLLAILRDIDSSDELRTEIAERMILSLNNAKLKGNV